MERLNQALVLLGFKPEQAPHVRSNLLHAIQLFAGMHKDVELERACEAALRAIRADCGSSPLVGLAGKSEGHRYPAGRALEAAIDRRDSIKRKLDGGSHLVTADELAEAELAVAHAQAALTALPSGA